MGSVPLQSCCHFLSAFIRCSTGPALSFCIHAAVDSRYFGSENHQSILIVNPISILLMVFEFLSQRAIMAFIIALILHYVSLAIMHSFVHFRSFLWHWRFSVVRSEAKTSSKTLTSLSKVGHAFYSPNSKYFFPYRYS